MLMMTSIHVKRCVAAMLLTLAAGAVDAADIVIAKGAGKTAVDLSEMRVGNDGASRDFLTVLQTGLIRSGWLERGRPDLSDYVISGTVQFEGGTLRAVVQVTQRSARRTLLSKTYNGDAAQVRRLAHQAADEILLAITGKKGFASARLVLVGNRTGNKELYLCDSDGRGLYPLTADKSVSLSPRWSPDGRQIYYTSYLRSFPAIYRIDLGSRARTRVANFAGLNTGGAISPDGRSMALILSKDGNPELYVMRLADGSLTRITRTPRAVEASPSWSPDGREIVYVSDQPGVPHLFIVSAAGGSPRQLTTAGRQNVSPDWGPHGVISYASLLGGKFQICIIDPRTREVRQITSDYVDHEEPSWAPNGRHLAVMRTEQGRSRAYLVDTMGDAPILLTETEGGWFSPRWSP
jgi:TolB protein